MTVSTCNSLTTFDSRLAIQVGGCGAGCVANEDPGFEISPCTNPFGREVTFDSVSSGIYYIYVFGVSSAVVGDFGVSVFDYERPTNNDVRDAVPLSVNGAEILGTTVNATKSSYCSSVNRGVFYSVLGTGTNLSVSTCSSVTNFRVSLAIQDGACNSACIAATTTLCQANSFGTTLTWSSVANRVYPIAVAAVSSTVGDYSIRVSTSLTAFPTASPVAPLTASPVAAVIPQTPPTVVPTVAPTVSPTVTPTRSPVARATASPSAVPRVGDEGEQTLLPTVVPPMPGGDEDERTAVPTSLDIPRPTAIPTCGHSAPPLSEEEEEESDSPSSLPTMEPSTQPSKLPSAQPMNSPSAQPSKQPSDSPSAQPSHQPSSLPSNQPSSLPSNQPSLQPSGLPSNQPSGQPSNQPSDQPSVISTEATVARSAVRSKMPRAPMEVRAAAPWLLLLLLLA
jgi:hypothetical protein